MAGSVINLPSAGSDCHACERCGQQYSKPYGLSAAQWAKRRFCSKRCAGMRRSTNDQDILTMYANGHSSTEIGAVIGLSSVQVGKIIASHGATRTLSEGKKLSQNRPETKRRMSEAKAGKPCLEHVKQALRARTGRKNANWRAGLTINAGGYLEFTASPANGEHAGRYLHQVIAEYKIGRALRPGEHVHHVDENKLNNDPNNIEVMTASEHARLHAMARQMRRAI